MEQRINWADYRHNFQCAYCGKEPETRDHVPSKILLEKPYPENLPVVPSCLDCNNGFSLDEEYFACMIECSIYGSADPEKLSRGRIKKILRRKVKLRYLLQNTLFEQDENIYFQIDENRFKNVINKLSFGHIKFECSETQFRSPSTIWYSTKEALSEHELNHFFSPVNLDIIPEVGSRAMQKIVIAQDGLPVSAWIPVQEGIYYYSVIETRTQKIVKLFIWNYLLCEVRWAMI